MSIFLVIPTKPFDEGKSRLSSTLDRTAREELNRSLFRRTLQCALEVHPSDRIVVISRSAEALDIAHSERTHVMSETRHGLNAAVAEATTYARRAGATGVLTLSCDLPLVTTKDVLAMLAVDSPRSVLVAPDRARTGTNALTVMGVEDFIWCFGPNSFCRHLDEARRVGVAARTIASEGLAFDLDTPEDYHDWRGRSGLFQNLVRT